MNKQTNVKDKIVYFRANAIINVITLLEKNHSLKFNFIGIVLFKVIAKVEKIMV